MNYKKETAVTGEDFIVRSNDDGTTTWIPTNEDNSDYQAYLNPVEHLTESVTKAK